MERIVGGVTRVLTGHGTATRVLDSIDGPLAILCQPGSESLGRALAGHDHPVLVLPDGDAAKALGVVEEVVTWLLGAGIRRDGAIVAVGGGALLDTAGFVAAVYLRGIDAHYLPTTLLGAVDASIGGKNGINVGGKNLVGTFTHPRTVVVDLDVIAANPPWLLSDGMAEVIKAGAIADPVLLAEVERDGLDADLGVVVDRAIAVKADVVDSDFTEQGFRQILNFGHTIGHAIEYLSGWSHGSSVGVGMLAAAAVSEAELGFADTARIVAALVASGLPTSAPEVDAAEVLALIQRDKKADAGGVRMVLLEAIGAPVVSHVDSATLGSALAAVGIGGP